VISTKYDGSPHWEYETRLVLERGSLIVTQDFAGQVYQTWKGPHAEPFNVRNHFWTDRWYNVMRCDRPRGGGLEYWYCNVTTPAQFDGETVRYADLDLDVQVFPTGEVRLLDEDEFLENSRRMGYAPDVIEQARTAAGELCRLAANREFPFGDIRTTA
jgi:hypothetical protein